MDEICYLLGVSRDEIKRSQDKYINNRNSHKLLGADEALHALIPSWLTPQRAKLIKGEMEEYAYKQYQSFYVYFDNQTNQIHNYSPEKQSMDVSDLRKLNAEDIFD